MVGVAKARPTIPTSGSCWPRRAKGRRQSPHRTNAGRTLEQLWMLAHDLGMADRITIHPDRLGPADRAACSPGRRCCWCPTCRPTVRRSACSPRRCGPAVPRWRPSIRTPREMLGSGAGLLLPDDEPESLAQAVGRLLGDLTRLEHARRIARAEAGRFAGPVVARRVAEVMESLGTDGTPTASAATRSPSGRPARPGPSRCASTAATTRSPRGTRRARLGVVAAALAGAGAAVVAVPEWRASVEWSRHAIAGAGRDRGDAAHGSTAGRSGRWPPCPARVWPRRYGSGPRASWHG